MKINSKLIFCWYCYSLSLSHTALWQVDLLYGSYFQRALFKIQHGFHNEHYCLLHLCWKILRNLISNVTVCGRTAPFKGMSSVHSQTSRDGIRQWFSHWICGISHYQLHVWASHGRNCIGKVSYATQGGLIKWSSTGELSLTSICQRVLKSGDGDMPQDFTVCVYSELVLFLHYA